MPKLFRYAVLYALVPFVLPAVPVTWYLNGVNLSDGGRIVGSFVFDADTNTYSSVNVATTPAASATSTASFSAGRRYTSPTGALFPLTGFKAGFLSDGPIIPNASGVLVLNFTASLSNGGGIVPITPGSGESTCVDRACISITAPSRGTVTAGSVVAAPAGGPQTWYLNGVTLDDGSQAVGSFVFDAGTSTFSQIQIQTTPGSTFNTSANYTAVLPPGSTGASQLIVVPGVAQAGSRVFKLTFKTGLTNAGGTVDMNTDTTESTCNSASCVGFAGVIRVLTAGSVTTVRPANYSKVVSHVVDTKSDFQTTLILTNLTDVPTAYTVRFYADDGTPWSPPGINASVVTNVIPPRGTQFLKTNASGVAPAPVDGWAEVDNAQNVGVMGVFDRTATNEGTVNGDPLGTVSFSVPFDSTGNNVIGLALANPDPNQTMTVLAVATDENGNILLNDSSIVLNPHAHTAFNFQGQPGYSALVNKRGILRIFGVVTSTNPKPPFAGLNGLELKFLGVGDFTSLLVTAQ